MVSLFTKGCRKLSSDLKNEALNVSRPHHAHCSNNCLRLCRHQAISSKSPVKSQASVTSLVEKTGL
eukprot:10910659-Ditylum_brightwellii.AAC.1